VKHDSNFSKSEKEPTDLLFAHQRLAESPFHSLFRELESQEKPENLESLEVPSAERPVDKVVEEELIES
jgi:hypothetical protein